MLHHFFLRSLIAAIGICTITTMAVAQENDLPILSSVAETPERFIPNGWTKDATTKEIKEDFNKDGLQDVCFLIRKEQQAILMILFARKDGYYVKSFAGVIYATEYLTQIGKRNGTLQLVFDFPAYEAVHMVTAYSRFQNGEWYVIGYTEESVDGTTSKNKKLVTDVNLLTGDVEETTSEKGGTPVKKKSKQPKQPLTLLQNMDNLPVMNY